MPVSRYHIPSDGKIPAGYYKSSVAGQMLKRKSASQKKTRSASHNARLKEKRDAMTASQKANVKARLAAKKVRAAMTASQKAIVVADKAAKKAAKAPKTPRTASHKKRLADKRANMTASQKANAKALLANKKVRAAMTASQKAIVVADKAAKKAAKAPKTPRTASSKARAAEKRAMPSATAMLIDKKGSTTYYSLPHGKRCPKGYHMSARKDGRWCIKDKTASQKAAAKAKRTPSALQKKRGTKAAKEAAAVARKRKASANKRAKAARALKPRCKTATDVGRNGVLYYVNTKGKRVYCRTVSQKAKAKAKRTPSALQKKRGTKAAKEAAAVARKRKTIKAKQAYYVYMDYTKQANKTKKARAPTVARTSPLARKHTKFVLKSASGRCPAGYRNSAQYPGYCYKEPKVSASKVSASKSKKGASARVSKTKDGKKLTKWQKHIKAHKGQGLSFEELSATYKP